MTDDDKQFEELLRSRVVPPMRSNLEHRIIQASLLEGGVKTVTRNRNILASIFDGLLLPKPALSLVAVMILGAVIGQGYDVNDFITESEGFYIMLDDIEYGDFL